MARDQHDARGRSLTAAAAARNFSVPAAAVLLVAVLLTGELPGHRCQSSACFEVAVEQASQASLTGTPDVAGLVSLLSGSCQLDFETVTSGAALECCQRLLKTQACVSEMCLFAVTAPIVMGDTAELAAAIWFACGCRFTSGLDRQAQAQLPPPPPPPSLVP